MLLFGTFENARHWIRTEAEGTRIVPVRYKWKNAPTRYATMREDEKIPSHMEEILHNA